MVRIVTLLATLILSAQAGAACPAMFDHEMRKLHSSNAVNLCELVQDKPVLVVNTASHCGFTPQFKGLQALYDKYRAQGLQVVGFASDDFRQEADSEEEAADICYVNFGVTFTMLAPTAVRGSDANPVFAELAAQTRAPRWNFNKYVVDGGGNVVAVYGSTTSPDDEELIASIEAVLKVPDAP